MYLYRAIQNHDIDFHNFADGLFTHTLHLRAFALPYCEMRHQKHWESFINDRAAQHALIGDWERHCVELERVAFMDTYHWDRRPIDSAEGSTNAPKWVVVQH